MSSYLIDIFNSIESLMNIKERFAQYPTDMQKWMIDQEKTKLIRIESALAKGKNFSNQLEDDNSKQWLLTTTELLEEYLSLLPSKDCDFTEVSQEYILRVWEILDNNPRLQPLIAQVETRYLELLRL